MSTMTSRRWVVAAWVAAVLGIGGLAWSAGVARAEGGTVKRIVVRPGDTLLRLADRHGVTVEQLRRWNPRRVRKGDVIRLGDTLVIHLPGAAPADPSAAGADAAAGSNKDTPSEAAKPAGPRWEGHYAVQAGDTLGGIALRLHLPLAELLRWNHLTKDSTIRVGKVLRYQKQGARPKPRTVGRPSAGRLINGEHLGRGPGYRLRFPRNAYALTYVNKILRRCAAHVAKRFPGTADLLYGDLSLPTGGPFPPHASHQSGRDADVGYYLKGNIQNKTLHRVAPYEVDYAKSWAYLRCALRTRSVVRVFMDSHIQRGYVRYVRKHKLASEALVKRLFEVAADDPKAALVVNVAGHDTHLHLRFACPEDAPKCGDDRGDRLFVSDEL